MNNKIYCKKCLELALKDFDYQPRRIWNDGYCMQHHPASDEKKKLIQKIRFEAQEKEKLERLHQSW